MYNFSQQLTSFIGRRSELNDIEQRLRDADCRLLTLVGPGGVGKTRLAIKAVSRLEDDFDDGVYCINLQQVETEDFFSSVAEALPISLSIQDSPRDQVLSYLQNKEILLLLDNFEHLLNRATFLSELLSYASDVKLLVTSREALKLHNEWLYPLHGLAVPSGKVENDFTKYDAVQLFMKRASHIQRDFSLDDERFGVMRICQLVEGIPLALELAASWSRILSCNDIADEIQSNIDFLTTNLRDVPERHQSMTAVFRQSWQRLSKDEQNAFRHLSVFRGGFDREAAQFVAGTTLSVISTLADKSLLRTEADGRYVIHELLRQYGIRKLTEASAEVVTNVRDSHSNYYMNLLADLKKNIGGEQQVEAATRIATDFNNIRTAWQWAVKQENVKEIAEASFTLYHFCQFRSRYLQGVEMFEQAEQILTDDILSKQPNATLSLIFLGWFYIRLGQFDRAQTMLNRVNTIYRHLDELPNTPYVIDPELGLGLIASMQSDYEESIRLLESGMQRSERFGYLISQATGHYILTEIHLAQGQHELAERHAQAAYHTSEQLRDRWFMAYCLNGLGNVATIQGDYTAATNYYEDSYAVRESFDDAEGMAVALTHLGEVALHQQDIVKAQHSFQKSYDIYQRINDQGGLATALHGLGKTMMVRNEIGTACRILSRALEIADDIQYVTLIVSVITSAAQLFIKTDRLETAVPWLDFVLRYASVSYDVKTRAEKLRSQLPQDDLDRFKPSSKETNSSTLEEIIISVQANLKMDFDEHRDQEEEMPRPSAPFEPLTERQQTVLCLLADGLTNKEIADRLTVVVGTVKAHNHHIYNKLGVNNRIQAVTRAKELGLI